VSHVEDVKPPAEVERCLPSGLAGAWTWAACVPLTNEPTLVGADNSDDDLLVRVMSSVLVKAADGVSQVFRMLARARTGKPPSHTC
jgi:hypothetical protein